MSRAWVVARRELRGYFDHPTAYILAVAFLALGLFLAFRPIYAQRIATLRPFFDLLPWLFAVFVPAITMRSVAEERRGGNLEWLLASPLREHELITGKFLGDWLFVAMVLAGALPAGIGLVLVSEADPGILTAQFAGALLLAAQFVAIGLWASSITRNQITAFILGGSVCLALVLGGLRVVQIGLPPVLAGAVAQLAVLSHFDSVARGVIDLRDVLYFLTSAGLFLVLAGVAVGRERLSRARGAWRRLRLGAAVIAAAVVVLNLLGGHIRGRLDLTRGGLYTLADGSRELVGGLDDIVRVTLFVSDNLPPEVQVLLRDVRDLVADLRAASNGNLVITEVDPDDDEEAAGEARALGIVPTEFNVLRDDQFEVRRGWFGLAIEYGGETRAIPFIDRTDDLEFRLATDIAALTSERQPVIAFASGFGARPRFEFRTLEEALGERYTTRTVALQQDTAPELGADSIDVLVLPAPTQPVSDGALRSIASYIERGGAALFLVESVVVNPQMPEPQPAAAGLDTLLADYGIAVGDGLIYDMVSHANVSVGRRGIFDLVQGYPLWPIVLPATEHATTRNLQNLSLGWAAPIEARDTARVTPLWVTSDQAGVRPGGFPIEPAMVRAFAPEDPAPQIVAAAVEPGADPEANGNGASTSGRFVIVGDADFLTDSFVRSNPQNLIFAANAIDWLAQEESLIRIRSKHRVPPALVFESDADRNLLKWGNLAGVPLLFIAFGALRMTRRRARAER